ncbi:MAG: helix-turn-helix transcriptional regulator, partial [Solirubrobacterales bacterium]
DETSAALEAFQRIGATREAERAEAALHRLRGKPDSLLTRREREVLALVAGGLSDREIAERLVISEHTVHRHVSNIRTKLRVPSRTAAAAHATKLKLI